MLRGRLWCVCVLPAQSVGLIKHLIYLNHYSKRFVVDNNSSFIFVLYCRTFSPASINNQLWPRKGEHELVFAASRITVDRDFFFNFRLKTNCDILWLYEKVMN